MTRSKAWCLSVSLTLSACVLPDYDVRDVAKEQPDSGVPGLGKISAGASGECGECLADKCAEQRTSCGSKCDEIALPLSPAVDVPTEANSYIQCMTEMCDSTCNARWGCVNQYTWPSPSKAYNVTIRIVDPVQNQPVKDAKVSACGGLDPACSLGGGMESMGTTDMDGRVTLQLQSSFFGYFAVDAGANFFPLVAMWSQPTYRVDNTFTLNVFPRSWLAHMGDQLNAKIEPEAGHLIFHAQNCLPLRFTSGSTANATGEGVKVSYSKLGANSTRVFYTTYALMVDPNQSSTSIAGSGYGGAFNLPPGAATVIGSFNNMDIANAGLPMRADTLGLVFLVPNARM
jgi:hypothetical protein